MKQRKKTGAQKKVKRFVIDVNSFISFFLNKEMDWLVRYISSNRLEIFIDKNLLTELERVLAYPKIRRILPLPIGVYVGLVELLGTYVAVDAQPIASPDPADDYLFNLAIQSDAKLLVTGDKDLHSWPDSPIEMITLKEFKHLY